MTTPATSIEDLPGWGPVELSRGTVDPADGARARRAGDERSVRRTAAFAAVERPVETLGATSIDPARFHRDVLLERAKLAFEDPDGEHEAVVPLSPVRARQVILTLTARVPSGTAASHQRDDTDLLVRLGGDPTRSSGRVPCPAHGGRGRNLSWRRAESGRVLLKCFSHGCTFSEIVAAVA